MSGHKILDNGAAEGSLVETGELMNRAYQIRADEVVVPDVMGSYRDTVQKAFDFEPWAQKFPQYKYIGVCQGKSAIEVFTCARAFAALGYFTTLALPRHLMSMHPQERLFLAGALLQLDELGSLNLDMHCLGAGTWMREPAGLCEHPNVRGIDTSLPIYMGLMAIELRHTTDYWNRPPGYFALDASPEQMEFILGNIDTYLNWACAPTPTRPLREVSS